MLQKVLAGAASALAIALIPATAMAHVVVSPKEVGIGSFQTFTTAVPNEKNQPTTNLRLVIPAGLQYVQPNVKPGWTIDEKTSSGGEFPTITEITWSGGAIPAGQRDDFLFSAQAPAKATSLHWKAYQTYADGTVVAWDQAPNGKDDEDGTPFSETNVVDDLTDDATNASTKTASQTSLVGPYILSAVSLLLSVVTLINKCK